MREVLLAILMSALGCAALAEEVPSWHFRVEGIAVYPDGTPAEEATVTAMTFCDPDWDRFQSEEFIETESEEGGRFVLEGSVARCSRLKVQAHKQEDYWLRTDARNELLLRIETQAPVVDVAMDRIPLLEVPLGDRGGILVVRTVESASGSFWPAIVSIELCHDDGLPGSRLWTSTSFKYPEIHRFFPTGDYCVGLVSASSLYPLEPNCTLVRVLEGQDQELLLAIEPGELTSDVVVYDAECPGIASNGPSDP